MSWASASDVLDRWVGPNRPTDQDYTIETLIADAEAFIRAEYPAIGQQITDGHVDVADVRRVVAQVVLRHMLNPTGIRSRNEATGPFTEGVTYAGDRPGELWYLSDAERQLLGDTTVGRGRTRAFSINPGGEPWKQ